MPVITTLQPLDADALVKILSEPKNAILKQYTQLFSLDDVKLELTPDALRAVAEETLKRNTGARGLRSVMEALLTDLMFEVPSRSYDRKGDRRPRLRPQKGAAGNREKSGQKAESAEKPGKTHSAAQGHRLSAGRTSAEKVSCRTHPRPASDSFAFR